MKNIEKLLRLKEGLKVDKIEEESGKKIIYVKNIKNKVRCPICNKYTKSIHDYLKPINIKYLKMMEESTILRITKRRFKCYKCNKVFTEKIDISRENKSISERLRYKVLQDLSKYNLTLKSIAEENNISENKVRNILEEAMEKHPSYISQLPRVISMDEFKADTEKGRYAYVLNDPIHKKVLDILPSRKKEFLITYFEKCENRNSVEFVISDMYEPYLVVTKIMFHKAVFVVDRFHYIRYIEDALDKIRIRLQEKYGEKSKEYKLLKNRKNVGLLRKYYNSADDWYTYTKRYKNKHMVEVLKIDILNAILNIDKDLKLGYQLKEDFLDIINHATFRNCKKQFLCWIDLCNESDIEEFIDAAGTIKNWLEYICNSFIDKRFSNGYTEGLNNKIKVIKRVAFGYRNFKFFRMRLLYILNYKNSKKVKILSFKKSQKTKN